MQTELRAAQQAALAECLAVLDGLVATLDEQRHLLDGVAGLSWSGGSAPLQQVELRLLLESVLLASATADQLRRDYLAALRLLESETA